MSIITTVLLVIINFILGNLVWQISKRKGCMKKLLNDQTTLNTYAKKLQDNKVLEEKDPKKIAMAGAFYTDNYGQNILFELKSSDTAFNKTKNLFVAGCIIVIIISLFISVWTLLFTLGAFLSSYLIPLSESAQMSVLTDLRTIMWNMYHYQKEKPAEFQEFIKSATTLNKDWLALQPLSTHN